MTNKDFNKRCSNFNDCNECPLFNKKSLCIVAFASDKCTVGEVLEELEKEISDVKSMKEDK